jgi:hypothetical protein
MCKIVPLVNRAFGDKITPMLPINVELPPAVRVAFDELRRLCATTDSVVLTQAAGRNLIRVMRDAGFTA